MFVLTAFCDHDDETLVAGATSDITILKARRVQWRYIIHVQYIITTLTTGPLSNANIILSICNLLNRVQSILVELQSLRRGN